jgi:hypothetical protein
VMKKEAKNSVAGAPRPIKTFAPGPRGQEPMGSKSYAG